MSKMKELRWIRALNSAIIPSYLVENVKKRDYSVETFMRYQDMTCSREDENGIRFNCYSHLYAMVNPENETKGMLWFTIDPLTQDLIIQTYSVDPEYWKDGGAVEKLVEWIKEIRSKANLKKVYWVTDYPKHSERHGFKRSKSVLMEYNDEEGENNG